MTSWLIRGTTRMSRVGKNTRCMYVAWKKHWLDLPEFAWVCLNLRGPYALRGITLYERSITTSVSNKAKEKNAQLENYYEQLIAKSQQEISCILLSSCM